MHCCANGQLTLAISLERIVAYTEIEQEPQPTEQGKPPAAWPTSGDVKVEGLTAKYSKACDDHTLCISLPTSFPTIHRPALPFSMD